MKSKYVIPAAFTALLLAACGNGEEESVGSKDLEMTTESKMIIDELDREVEITGTDRIVMGSILPYFSTWFVATNHVEK